MSIDLVKVPEGATHWSPPGSGRLEAYWRPDGNGGYDCWAITDHLYWQTNNAVLPIYAIEIWTGEGRPSVGTICEFLDLRGGVKRDWVKVCVRYISDVMLVVKPDHPIDCQYEIALHPDTAQFRILRTPEQIAAEERAATVNLMVSILFEEKGSSMGPAERGYCEALYDAGYRKQVAP